MVFVESEEKEGVDGDWLGRRWRAVRAAAWAVGMVRDLKV